MQNDLCYLGYWEEEREEDHINIQQIWSLDPISPSPGCTFTNFVRQYYQQQKIGQHFALLGKSTKNLVILKSGCKQFNIIRVKCVAIVCVEYSYQTLRMLFMYILMSKEKRQSKINWLFISEGFDVLVIF